MQTVTTNLPMRTKHCVDEMGQVRACLRACVLACVRGYDFKGLFEH